MYRSRLLAYLIGAGVAGTLLVFPYVARALWGTVFPELLDAYVPFFLLPLVWGLWNWLHVRLQPTLNIGAWGALLGLILGLAINALLYAQDQWFSAAAFLPVFAAALYFLLWALIVGAINGALGVAEHEKAA